MKTISELECLLKEAEESPKTFFAKDIDRVLKQVLFECHPDRFHHDSEKRSAEEIFKKFSNLADAARKPPVVIKTKLRSYTLESMLAAGDVSDVHLAKSNNEGYLLKMSRIPGADKLLAHEYFVLSELADKAGDSSYKYYFPSPVETIKAKDGINKQINVFQREDGGYTLEQVLAKHPSGLKGEHLAWVYKRLLTAIGYAHNHGWIHNSVLPCHVIIYPGTHGVQLIDWKFASGSAVLKNISAKYRKWYPSEVTKKLKTNATTDIFMATQCLVHLAGGDFETGICPLSVPKPMASYFRSALIQAQSMRPQNAWGFMDEFTDMLESIYGTPKFHSLSMS